MRNYFKPMVERLELRDVPSTYTPASAVLPVGYPLAPTAAGVMTTGVFEGHAMFAEGSGVNAPATVTVLDYNSSPIAIWKPFGINFTGGLRVAMADLNGDGYDDLIVGTGPGGITTILVYDGKLLLTNQSAASNPNLALVASYHPFGPGFSGGAFVAGIPANGTQQGEIVVGADSGGGPQISVWNADGSQVLGSWYSFSPNFTGGVHVAVGDFQGVGTEDIVTSAGPGGGPQVNIYSVQGFSLQYAFDAFAPNFNGGVCIAVGDLSSAGNGQAELVTSEQTESAAVSVWSYGQSQPTFSFLLHDYPDGVHVGIAFGRTGMTAVEPILFISEDNLPVTYYCRGQDILNGNFAIFSLSWIPPGNLAIVPGSPLLDPTFLNVQGGWIS